MVAIVESPKDFTPRSEGIIFVAESDVETDFMVDIIDAQTDEIVGSKVISGVSRVVIDIAPYVEVQAFTVPKQAHYSSLVDIPAKRYYISVQTTEDSVVSDVVKVSNNLTLPIVNSLQTVMPRVRMIGYGECDDLRIVVEEGSSIWVDITTDIGEVHSFDIDNCGGLAQLHIDTSEFDSLSTMIGVSIMVDDSRIAGMEYCIVPRYSGAVRLGWISSLGTIEYFTFPITLSKSVVSERKKIFMHRVQGDIISNKSFERITLRSQALSEGVAEALATILTAPKVWIVGDEVTDVEIVDNQIVTSSYNGATVVEITVEYGGKEVVL